MSPCRICYVQIILFNIQSRQILLLMESQSQLKELHFFMYNITLFRHTSLPVGHFLGINIVIQFAYQFELALNAFKGLPTLGTTIQPGFMSMPPG